MLFSGFNNFSHVNISECFKHSLILGEVEEFIERKKIPHNLSRIFLSNNKRFNECHIFEIGISKWQIFC